MLYLNLLPQSERSRIKFESIYRLVRFELLFLIGIVVIMSVSVFSVDLYLRQTIDRLSALSKESMRVDTPLVAETQALNQTIDGLISIQEGFSLKSGMLREFTKLVPDGVRINQLSINEENVVRVRGVYEKRADLLRLKENLEEHFLTEIIFPISNLLKPENGEFSVHGIIVESVRQQNSL